MELSYFLAQLFGLSLAIFAFIGFLRPKLINSAIENFTRQPLVDLLFSFAGIVIGLSIVLTHNIWVASWPVIITVIGWTALIKGATFLYTPNTLMKLGKSVYKTDSQTKLILFIAFFFGLYLASKGFGYL